MVCAGAGTGRLIDGPAPGVSNKVFVTVGRDEGGGARRGITGDVGVDGRGAGDGEVDVVPLKPANIAGTGVAIAIWNDGGGAKYPSSASAIGTIGGVGGRCV